MTVTLDFAPRLMPAPAAAHYLGVGVTTLRGLPIPRRKLGAKRLYDKRDLDAYADDLPVESDREAPGDNTCDALFGEGCAGGSH
ncbi:helix-turn-helix domain-containing protein [Maritimibacter sp. 55A14]|uniref:helix-turn-helix domain-containing protein n=1 Tax=Maritimibacter sp. 55A14 TaxID=2174844 RepID=UPI001E306B01|nr:helix-turn-helix domain-containing protein [Maritimibacter sp. 55A14]